MDVSGLKFIGVGLACFGMLGAAIGVAMIFNALLNGVARNPSAGENMQKMALIGAGLVEAMGLFSFVIGILILFS